MTPKTEQPQDEKATSTMQGERYMNVDDVAALLGVAPKTVYGWASAKAIPHVKLGRSVLRFRLSDIEAWVESRAVAVIASDTGAAQGSEG